MSTVLAKDSGPATKEIYITKVDKGTTFRLIGEEADVATMSDIVLKQPADVYVSGYSGNWIAKKREGLQIVLNSDNREQVAYGVGRILFDKTEDQQVGVVWDKE